MPAPGSNEANILAKVGRSFATVDVHRDLLSAADRAIIGFAVPDRRKSASLVELMKASCKEIND